MSWPEWTSPDGRIRLINADCLEVLPTLDANSIDMIWTDPPYGHSNADGDFLSRRHEIMQDGRATAQEAIANDDGELMREVVDGMLTEAARILKRDCCCCCCCCGGGGPSPTFAWVAQRMDSGGLSFFHSVIWDKRNPGVGFRYRRQHEMVMVANRKTGKLAWSGELDAIPNIISQSKPREQYHPNEKPVSLVSRFIVAHVRAKDVVLDPFAGSCTTAVACIRTDRHCIAIEKERKYWEIGIQRCKAEYARTALFAEGERANHVTRTPASQVSGLQQEQTPLLAGM